MYRGPFQPWFFSGSVVLRGQRGQQQKNKEFSFDLALLRLFFKSVSDSRTWRMCFSFSRQIQSRSEKRISHARRSGLRCYRSVLLQREATFLGGSGKGSAEASLVYTGKNRLESNTVTSLWTIVKRSIILHALLPLKVPWGTVLHWQGQDDQIASLFQLQFLGFYDLCSSCAW